MNETIKRNMTINVPKPGDALPFVVAEWEGNGYRYHAGYDAGGNVFVEGKMYDFIGPYNIKPDSASIWAIFALLGLPMSIKPTHAVAEVSE